MHLLCTEVRARPGFSFNDVRMWSADLSVVQVRCLKWRLMCGSWASSHSYQMRGKHKHMMFFLDSNKKWYNDRHSGGNCTYSSSKAQWTPVFSVRMTGGRKWRKLCCWLVVQTDWWCQRVCPEIPMGAYDGLINEFDTGSGLSARGRKMTKAVVRFLFGSVRNCGEV